MFFAPSQSRQREQIPNMYVSKTVDHTVIKINMPNPSQDPQASSKAPNEDLKDMDVLCTFKIQVESQSMDHGCIEVQWPYPIQDQDTKSQPGTSKTPNQDLKAMKFFVP